MEARLMKILLKWKLIALKNIAEMEAGFTKNIGE